MKGRIAVPIHNAGGELVAYAGRWAGDDSEIPEGEGKYKLQLARVSGPDDDSGNLSA